MNNKYALLTLSLCNTLEMFVLAAITYLNGCSTRNENNRSDRMRPKYFFLIHKCRAAKGLKKNKI